MADDDATTTTTTAAADPEAPAAAFDSTSASSPLPLQFSAELFTRTPKRRWDRVELHVYDHSLTLTRRSDDDDGPKAAQQKEDTLQFDDIVGMESIQDIHVTIHAYILEDTRPGDGCCGCFAGSRNKKGRRYSPYSLRFETQSARDDFARQLENRALAERRVPSTVLVLINPVSGTGKAVDVYERTVFPLFHRARIRTQVCKTEARSHARDIVHSADLSAIQGIVCVGGDGIFNEAVQALIDRKDFEAVSKSVALCAVPGGTGNGMAKSLAERAGEDNTAITAALPVALGKTCMLDVGIITQMESGSSKKSCCILSFSWGFSADADIESEYIRWMGDTRFDVQALVRLIKLRRYKGKLSYLPPETNPGDDVHVEGGDHYHNDDRGHDDDISADLDLDPDSYEKSLERNILPTSQDTNTDLALHAPDEPLRHTPNEIFDDISEASGPTFSGVQWVDIDGPFTMLWVKNVAWDNDSIELTPAAEPDDGMFHMVYIRDDMSSWELFKLFSKVDQGSHLSHPKVHIQKIRGLKLKTDSSDTIGHIANDGELLACGDARKRAQYQSPMDYHTQFELIVQPKLVQVFALPTKASQGGRGTGGTWS